MKLHELFIIQTSAEDMSIKEPGVGAPSRTLWGWRRGRLVGGRVGEGARGAEAAPLARHEEAAADPLARLVSCHVGESAEVSPRTGAHLQRHAKRRA